MSKEDRIQSAKLKAKDNGYTLYAGIIIHNLEEDLRIMHLPGPAVPLSNQHLKETVRALKDIKSGRSKV